MKIAVIGAGIIGSSWAISALRAGHDVVLHDPFVSPEALDQCIEKIRLASATIDKNKARVEFSGNLIVEESLSGITSHSIEYIQEAIVESLPKKYALFQKLDKLIPASVTIASSSSALTASQLMCDLHHRERCLIAHPSTPPHLLPAVELVPAPFTSTETLAHAEQVLLSLGQKPVVLHKEISGFVMNRLQAALLLEMLALIRDGVVSPSGADTLIRDAFGIRWSVLGPLEGVHLNAPGGIADYFNRYRSMFNDFVNFPLLKHDILNDEVIDELASYCAEITPVSEITKRQQWRDSQFEEISARRKSAGLI